MWNYCGIFLILAALAYSYSGHEGNIRAGYEYLPDVGYYKFHNDLLDWEDAQNTCLEESAQLAIINSEEERIELSVFMKNQTQHPSSQNVFCGFHDLFTESNYVTITGVPLKDTGYMTWKTGEPHNTSTQNCGAFDYNGRLLDEICTVLNPFVCEKQIWTGYELFEGVGYYKLYTDGKTWADAYDICKMDGGHLAVLNSQKEADAIFEIFSSHPIMPNVDDSYIAQLGFSMVYDRRHVNDADKNYITVNGQTVNQSGYTEWAYDQPNPGEDFYCGAITRYGNLTLSNCSHVNAFFCEHEL